MQEKYKSKGLVLVALSHENAGLVAPYVSKHKIPYIVGSDAAKTRDAFGIGGYPTAFLVDPSGKVAWKGHPMEAEDAIEALLKKSPPRSGGALLENAAAKALKKASAYYKKGAYAKAFKAFQEVAKKYAGTKSAKKAVAWVAKMKASEKIMAHVRQEEADRVAGRWLETARVMAKNGARNDAIRYYEKLLKKYPDTSHASSAREELSQIH